MPGPTTRRRIAETTRRMVVKVGTSAITGEDGLLDRRAVSRLAGEIARAMASGVSVTLVASGAVGAGLGELGLAERPRTLPELQAVAAVGQGQLMRTLHDLFARRDVRVAQLLVTRQDFEDRTRYLNIRNTLSALAERNVLAVVNENDAVAVDELKYGDNDIIAALVANMLGADVLVLLSVVDGVIKDGQVLDVIEAVTPETLTLAGDHRSKLGSGGMGSKLSAMGMVVDAGEIGIIANARTPKVLARILAGEEVGTVFVPSARKLSSRARWLRRAARPAGRIIVDDGAVRALTAGGKSLLPSGITAVEGTFREGDLVIVCDPAGRSIARGLTNYPADQVRAIQGKRTSQIAAALGDKPYDEVIHRDNLALE